MYFKLLNEIISEGLKSGEFKSTSTSSELMKIYAMYERAMLYDLALLEGSYSLTKYSDYLLSLVLDTFVRGV